MTVRKTRHKAGPFIVEGTTVDCTKPGAATILKDALEVCTPPGRIAQWRPHAERLGVGLDELDKAEALIPEQNTDLFWEWERFEKHMERAQRLIERRQFELNEETLLPLAKRGENDLKQKTESGFNSHGMTKEERQSRDDEILKDYDDRAGKRSDNSIFQFLAKKYKLDKDHIRKRIVRLKRPAK